LINPPIDPTAVRPSTMLPFDVAFRLRRSRSQFQLRRSSAWHPDGSRRGLDLAVPQFDRPERVVTGAISSAAAPDHRGVVSFTAAA
jgi:hypothetical protein